ncbi:hypothetical protein AgCh_035048 [Apium graveolens]
MNSNVITQHDNNTRTRQVNNTTSTQEIKKNEDKANTKNQKIRRNPEVCLQKGTEASRSVATAEFRSRHTWVAAGFSERTATSGIQKDDKCEACQEEKSKTTSHQMESTTYRAFMVNQQKVIESPSAQFNNSMLQDVKGEIDGIDDSYPSSGMEVYNTTYYFNKASQ